jgi:hypothetical protein
VRWKYWRNRCARHCSHSTRVFTPTTFRHTKRLPIRISRPSHKKFHFKSFTSKKIVIRMYFIVIMITVLIMIVIFWVLNFKTQNYFVISTTQNVYLRLPMYDCSNFVHSCRIFGISELQTV